MLIRYSWTIIASILVDILLLLSFPANTDVINWGCHASADTNGIFPQNDGYCDDRIAGSDEQNSSACSFFVHGVGSATSRSVFTCSKSASVDGTVIPLSRVQDGVCDCCDGSDERDSPFPVLCEDVCGDAELAAKHSALLWHRNVQAGLRAKRDITVPFLADKAAQRKSYDDLKKDRDRLNEMLGVMKYYLRWEEYPEMTIRWRLIRERVYRCALGMVESCEGIFHSGYMDTDEIVHEGFPEEFALAKAKLRFNKDGPEKTYLNSLRGMERVQATLCEAEYMLPDESAHVFILVGEFIRHVSSPAGKESYFKKPLKQMRESTLFAPFLDDGERGHTFFVMLVLETAGLLLAPLTLLLQAGGAGLASLGDHLFGALKRRCDDANAAIVDKASSSSNLLVAAASACDVVMQVLSVEYRDSRAGKGDSLVSTVLNRLDPFSYSGVMALADRTQYLRSSLWWTVSVAWQAPRIFYGVYVQGLHQQLPPRRHACLLRYGIAAALRERDSVERRIAAEEHLRKVKRVAEEKARARAEDQRARGVDATNTQSRVLLKDRARQLMGFDTAADSSSPSASSSSGKGTSGDASSLSFQYIDFGAEGVWEAVRDKCAEKDIGEYRYSLCLFGHAKQNNVLIGKFSDWGVLQPSSSLAGSPTTGTGLPPTTGPSSGSSTNGNGNGRFTSQTYDKGALCVRGSANTVGQFQERPKRATQVHLSCAPNFEILEVEETEKCLYIMQVTSPLACEEAMETESMRQLQLLGVFGFAEIPLKTISQMQQQQEQQLQQQQQQQQEQEVSPDGS